ncbi:von Willebrand factor type A domain-containing protein [Glaciihabitans tibetensis]|uniref:von Willebrand factor type A domain-containing protein n=1 Tax=Glaciihabitans tibetensis TaxID=1266600 RepID=A0A2T0VHG5_9MICO|nr:VWA domain-containing protein [Glaciihabitans tibetensis]PRY69640.1 von Willebrand factor type A domain-containing protein [Glaciihabitans tibetensis]
MTGEFTNITTLINWWMPGAAALVGAVTLAIVILLRKRRARDDAPSVPIAHADRLTALPSYRRALRRYRALLVGSIAAVLIAVLAGVALAARPAAPALAQPELATRDIVLCLDVSGSMVDYDAQIVDVFAELSSQFSGERLSLVLFNASAVTYFPLSSDYAYITRQLERIRETFETPDETIESGTLLGDGSSLIGDGLASCTLRFDTPEAERSRSIILATDNLVAGDSIYTLPEAGQLAIEKDIRVYGINPGDTLARDYLADLAEEFRTVTEGTGGTYYALDDPDAVPGIVERITAEQAAALPGAPELILGDQPRLPFVLLLLGVLATLVLQWRLRR